MSRGVARVLFVATLAAACTHASHPVAAPLPAPRSGVASYDGIVSVDPNAGVIDARWRIAFAAEALHGDSATFLLNEGLVVSRLAGGDVLGYSRATESGTTHLTVRFAPTVRARG